MLYKSQQKVEKQSFIVKFTIKTKLDVTDSMKGNVVKNIIKNYEKGLEKNRKLC